MKNNFRKNALGCACVLMLLLSNINCTSGDSKSANEKVVRGVYAAYEKKDWNSLTSLFGEGFNFSSPVDDHIDLKTYKGRCWPNAYNIERFNLDKVVVDGDDAYVTYHCYTKNNKVFLNTEHFTLKDGKIKEFTCFFGPGIGFPNNTGK